MEHFFFANFAIRKQLDQMNTTDIKISELPEEMTADGLKIYGPTSYET